MEKCWLPASLLRTLLRIHFEDPFNWEHSSLIFTFQSDLCLVKSRSLQDCARSSSRDTNTNSTVALRRQYLYWSRLDQTVFLSDRSWVDLRTLLAQNSTLQFEMFFAQSKLQGPNHNLRTIARRKQWKSVGCQPLYRGHFYESIFWRPIQLRTCSSLIFTFQSDLCLVK